MVILPMRMMRNLKLLSAGRLVCLITILMLKSKLVRAKTLQVLSSKFVNVARVGTMMRVAELMRGATRIKKEIWLFQFSASTSRFLTKD